MTRARCSTCRGTDRDRAKTGADRLRPRRHSMRGRALSLVWLAVMASPLAIAWPDATAAKTTAPQTVDPVTRHVAAASRRFGLPQAWIWAVMRAESAGDVRADRKGTRQNSSNNLARS